MSVDYEKIVKDLVRPLVVNPDDLLVKQLSDEDRMITIQIMVNEEDLGRVIGKNGRIANAIRTIAYASAAREHKKITINIESF